MNQNKLQEQVKKIVLQDNQALKNEKIDEFKHGLRPDGSIIGTYRSQKYKLFKQSRNPLAGGNVDLFLTGDFSNSLFVKNASKGFIFDGSNSKTEDLKSKYGLDIMGLNQQWFNERQRKVYKSILVQQINAELHK